MDNTTNGLSRVSKSRCSRCGKNHIEIEFKGFNNPADINDLVYTRCIYTLGCMPTTDEPILNRIIANDG